MAITETSLTTSIMTFLFYCVLPLALFFYLFSAPNRKRQRKEEEKLKANALSQNNQTQEKAETTLIKDGI